MAEKGSVKPSAATEGGNRDKAQSTDTKPQGMVHRFRGYLPVVIDVETGGFNAQTDALLEIAAVMIGMNQHGQLERCETISYHVEPFAGANISDEALAFNGINPYTRLRGAIPEKEALSLILQAIRKHLKATECHRAVLVGHNAHFDHGFLRAAIERSEIKRNPFHPFSSFDTATLSALALGHTVLAESCRRAGIDFCNESAHSASYDAERTADLFCQIVNRWSDLGGWPIQSPE